MHINNPDCAATAWNKSIPASESMLMLTFVRSFALREKNSYKDIAKDKADIRIGAHVFIICINIICDFQKPLILIYL